MNENWVNPVKGNFEIINEIHSWMIYMLIFWVYTPEDEHTNLHDYDNVSHEQTIHLKYEIKSKM